MRVPFQLNNFQPFTFSVEGKTYSFQDTVRLAFKPNLTANVHEYIVQLPDEKKIWLTIVGDQDAVSPAGIERGWYVTQPLDDESAASLVKAFSLWAADLR